MSRKTYVLFVYHMAFKEEWLIEQYTILSLLLRFQKRSQTCLTILTMVKMVRKATGLIMDPY